MLINLSELIQNYQVHPTGVLHVGACHLEELSDYLRHGIKSENIYWVEANPEIVVEMRNKYPSAKIYQAAISSTFGQEVELIVTNNMQSSSLLELEEHKKEHPHVHEIKRVKVTTNTLDKLVEDEKLDLTNVNFLNIDIQGLELEALKGAEKILPKFKYLYLEVNSKYLYKNCALLPEIDDFLGKRGFTRKAINMTQFGWGDALYVIQN